MAGSENLEKKCYIILHIDLMLKKTLGFPSGVEWVKWKGRSDRGSISDCVAGRCH